LRTGAREPGIVLAVTSVGVVLERPDGSVCEVGRSFFDEHYVRRLDADEELRQLEGEVVEAERAVMRAWERVEAQRRRMGLGPAGELAR
jgi:hypothetical protein